MATGRRPYFDTLNLESTGVEFTSKGIAVNKFFETNIQGIYAVGDVIGGMMLAHVASHDHPVQASVVISSRDGISGNPDVVNILQTH